MAQRTPLLASEVWNLIPEDENVFAQYHNIPFFQRVNQKHNRCRFQNLPHTRFFKTNLLLKVPKLHDKIGRFSVQSFNRFRKLNKFNSEVVTFTEQNLRFHKGNVVGTKD